MDAKDLKSHHKSHHDDVVRIRVPCLPKHRIGNHLHVPVRKNHASTRPHLRRPRRRRAGRAAGAAAARLCGIHALLARAGDRTGGGGLSRGGAEPARLFAGRAAGYRRHRELSYRPPDGRCDGDRRRPAAMATAASIWSATTGAAASPGRLPIAFRSGWRRSPCCRGRIPTPSIGRCKCPTAIRRIGRGTTRRFSSLMRPMSCLPTTPNGCASG